LPSYQFEVLLRYVILQLLSAVDQLSDGEHSEVAPVLKQFVPQARLKKFRFGEFIKFEELNQRVQRKCFLGSRRHEKRSLCGMASLDVGFVAQVCCRFRNQIWFVAARFIEDDESLFSNLVIVELELRMEVNGSSCHLRSDAGFEREVFEHFLPLVCYFAGLIWRNLRLGIESEGIIDLGEFPLLLDGFVPRMVLEMRYVRNLLGVYVLEREGELFEDFLLARGEHREVGLRFCFKNPALFSAFIGFKWKDRHEFCKILRNFIVTNFLVEISRHWAKIVGVVVQIRDALACLAKMLEVKEVEKFEDLHLRRILHIDGKVEYRVKEFLSIGVVQHHARGPMAGDERMNLCR
jgi:hypothetical protein